MTTRLPSTNTCLCIATNRYSLQTVLRKLLEMVPQAILAEVSLSNNLEETVDKATAKVTWVQRGSQPDWLRAYAADTLAVAYAAKALQQGRVGDREGCASEVREALESLAMAKALDAKEDWVIAISETRETFEAAVRAMCE